MIIHKTQIQIYIHLPFTVEDTKDDGEEGGELAFLGSINTVRVTV